MKIKVVIQLDFMLKYRISCKNAHVRHKIGHNREKKNFTTQNPKCFYVCKYNIESIGFYHHPFYSLTSYQPLLYRFFLILSSVVAIVNS